VLALQSAKKEKRQYQGKRILRDKDFFEVTIVPACFFYFAA
jgi:hypothetical protein